MPRSKLLIWSLLVLSGVACVDIQGPVMDDLEANDVLAEVRIRSAAIMIAQGDSFQISVDLIAMNGDTIPYHPENITWTSSEAKIVPVTSTGMIHGRAISEDPVFVAVTYVHGYVTRVDTVNVYVTAEKVEANAIRLISLDSNRIGAFPMSPAPRVRIDLYKDNTLIEQGALLPLQIDEPMVAILDRLGWENSKPVYRIQNNKGGIGKFWIRASLNLYGDEVSDSLSFTGLYSALGSPGILISATSFTNPRPIPILEDTPLNINQLCGALTIINSSAEAIDILFSDSTASSTGCTRETSQSWLGVQYIGGNVLNLPPNSSAYRVSNTAGIIQYIIRKSATQEMVPWLIGHFEQIDVKD